MQRLKIRRDLPSRSHTPKGFGAVLKQHFSNNLNNTYYLHILTAT